MAPGPGHCMAAAAGRPLPHVLGRTSTNKPSRWEPTMRNALCFAILRALVSHLQLQMSIEIIALPSALARVGSKLVALALASVAARLIVAEVESYTSGEEHSWAAHHHVGAIGGTKEMKSADSGSQIAIQISGPFQSTQSCKSKSKP